jgi:hypothetical protein
MIQLHLLILSQRQGLKSMSSLTTADYEVMFMRKHVRWLSILMLLAVSILATSTSNPVSAKQQVPLLASGSATNQHMGFDTCALPSPSDMQHFWTGTPYWWYNVYIGGENYTCGPATVTASWLNTVHTQNQAWNFLFNWAGLRPPCSTENVYKFSPDPTTAYNQGAQAASSAYQALINLGITNQALGTAIVFDLDDAPPQCQNATNAFIQGWLDILNYSPAQVPGVYGSVCGSNLVALAGLARPPTFIWGAWYNGNPSTKDLYAGGCGVPSNDWVNHQRFKQYNGTHNETYNGTTLSIDNDCADGPTSPNGTNNADTQCIS